MELETVATQLAPGLLRYCLGRTGDRSMAEELSQEALAALVQRWRTAGPPECPEAFAFTVARRRVGRRLWRQRLMQPFGDGPERVAPEPVERNAWPDRRAELRSELAAVHAALGGLSARDREALLLVTAGELTTEAAAVVLGISPSALKMRLHRARQRLTRKLEREHERSTRAHLAERT